MSRVSEGPFRLRWPVAGTAPPSLLCFPPVWPSPGARWGPPVVQGQGRALDSDGRVHAPTSWVLLELFPTSLAPEPPSQRGPSLSLPSCGACGTAFPGGSPGLPALPHAPCLSAAEEYLSFAFEHCHRSSQKNKRMILIYLLPVKMLLVSEGHSLAVSEGRGWQRTCRARVCASGQANTWGCRSARLFPHPVKTGGRG